MVEGGHVYTGGGRCIMILTWLALSFDPIHPNAVHGFDELGFVGHYFVWHIRVLLLKRLSRFLINSEQSEVIK